MDEAFSDQVKGSDGESTHDDGFELDISRDEEQLPEAHVQKMQERLESLKFTRTRNTKSKKLKKQTKNIADGPSLDDEDGKQYLEMEMSEENYEPEDSYEEGKCEEDVLSCINDNDDDQSYHESEKDLDDSQVQDMRNKIEALKFKKNRRPKASKTKKNKEITTESFDLDIECQIGVEDYENKSDGQKVDLVEEEVDEDDVGFESDGWGSSQAERRMKRHLTEFEERRDNIKGIDRSSFDEEATFTAKVSYTVEKTEDVLDEEAKEELQASDCKDMEAIERLHDEEIDEATAMKNMTGYRTGEEDQLNVSEKQLKGRYFEEEYIEEAFQQEKKLEEDQLEETLQSTRVDGRRYSKSFSDEKEHLGEENQLFLNDKLDEGYQEIGNILNKTNSPIEVDMQSSENKTFHRKEQTKVDNEGSVVDNSRNEIGEKQVAINRTNKLEGILNEDDTHNNASYLSNETKERTIEDYESDYESVRSSKFGSRESIDEEGRMRTPISDIGKSKFDMDKQADEIRIFNEEVTDLENDVDRTDEEYVTADDHTDLESEAKFKESISSIVEEFGDNNDDEEVSEVYDEDYATAEENIQEEEDDRSTIVGDEDERAAGKEEDHVAEGEEEYETADELTGLDVYEAHDDVSREDRRGENENEEGANKENQHLQIAENEDVGAKEEERRFQQDDEQYETAEELTSIESQETTKERPDQDAADEQNNKIPQEKHNPSMISGDLSTDNSASQEDVIADDICTDLPRIPDTKPTTRRKKSFFSSIMSKKEITIKLRIDGYAARENAAKAETADAAARLAIAKSQLPLMIVEKRIPMIEAVEKKQSKLKELEGRLKSLSIFNQRIKEHIEKWRTLEGAVHEKKTEVDTRRRKTYEKQKLLTKCKKRRVRLEMEIARQEDRQIQAIRRSKVIQDKLDMMTLRLNERRNIVKRCIEGATKHFEASVREAARVVLITRKFQQLKDREKELIDKIFDTKKNLKKMKQKVTCQRFELERSQVQKSVKAMKRERGW